MSYPAALEICKTDLYTDIAVLLQRYPAKVVARVARIRDMHQWMTENPEKKDSEFVSHVCEGYNVSKVTAYEDLKILKALLPNLSRASVSFHRWRYNEMILDSFAMAKEQGDIKMMEKSATSYAKFNRVDAPEEDEESFAGVPVQPFVATTDPSVLGIEPIPNIQEKISAMLAKYSAEICDIEDVDYETVDMNLDEIFGGGTAHDDEPADTPPATDRLLI